MGTRLKGMASSWRGRRGMAGVIVALGVMLVAGCDSPSVSSEVVGTVDSEGYVHYGGGVTGRATSPANSVNSYLWRASLDTMSFMPLTSADAFGGVLISDWYAPPAVPNERFKVNIYVIGPRLRADSLRAVVFRQTRQPNGSWVDASVDPSTARGLEDTILTRARQLRAQAAAQ